MIPKWYILNDDHTVRPAEYGDNGIPLSSELDLVYDKDGRSKIVGSDRIGNYFVSTIFLGLDHNYNDGPPLIFETMVFDSEGHGEEMDRYSTWDEAVAGHKAMCDMVYQRGSGLSKEELERAKSIITPLLEGD